MASSLLLLLALSPAYLQRLPLTTALIYLGVGVALGPLGFGLLAVDMRQSAPWLEHLTEIAVIVSLSMIGIGLFLIVSIVERLLLPWYYESREVESEGLELEPEEIR